MKKTSLIAGLDLHVIAQSVDFIMILLYYVMSNNFTFVHNTMSLLAHVY